MADNIYRACGCRDEQGSLYGPRCPKLANDAKHGTWGYYIVTGKDTVTGRRKTERKRGFPTKRAAQMARNKVAARVDKGNYVTPSKLTYAAYLADWLPRHASTGQGLKATTQDTYQAYIDNDIKQSLLGGLQLSEIRRAHVAKFISVLQDDGRGAVTIRRIVAVVKVSLTSAVAEELIDVNPAAGVRLPTVERKEFEPWQPEQVGTFLDEAAKHRLGALFEVTTFTGLRRGEIIGLRWDDVDLATRQLHVRHNRTQAKGRVVETSAKTRAGARTIDLDDRTVGALIGWKLRQDSEATEWAEAWRGTGYVFTYEDGSPLRPLYVTRLFDTIRAAAGLPTLTFHGLRHEAASLMIASGADIALVSKRLGHSTIGVTSDIYSHLIGSASRQAAEAAAALVPKQGATTMRQHS